MLNTILLSSIFAILSPFAWGLMNVLDKFVVSNRVKKPLSFAFIAGMVNLAIGILLALPLNWSGLTFSDLLFPAIAGMLLGAQFYLYYVVLAKEDVSSVVGFVYFYPVIVAILSFLFLNEKLHIISYAGVGFILFGVVMLSVRMKKIRLKVGAWMIIVMIMNVALSEFFIKLATTNLPELNGIAVNCIAIGLMLLPLLLHTKTRKGISAEVKNTKWALLNESLTFAGVITLYFAMAGLPATVVSSLAATQPLIVLILEKIFHNCGIKICRDTKLLSKLVPIILIVLGIIMLYLPELALYL